MPLFTCTHKGVTDWIEAPTWKAVTKWAAVVLPVKANYTIKSVLPPAPDNEVVRVLDSRGVRVYGTLDSKGVPVYDNSQPVACSKPPSTGGKRMRLRKMLGKDLEKRDGLVRALMQREMTFTYQPPPVTMTISWAEVLNLSAIRDAVKSLRMPTQEEIAKALGVEPSDAAFRKAMTEAVRLSFIREGGKKGKYCQYTTHNCPDPLEQNGVLAPPAETNESVEE